MLVQLPRHGNIGSFDDARRDTRATPDAHGALDVFERLLRRGWSGWAEDRPLANRFFVRLQHCPVIEGVRLARLAEEVEGGVDPRLLRSCVRRLVASTEWHQFVAGETTLWFAAALLRRGRSVRLIGERNDQIPDLSATLAERAVTIELKGMHSGDDDRFSTVVQALLDAGVDINTIEGQLHTLPAREDLTRIIAEVETMLASGTPEAVVVGAGSIRRRAAEGGFRGPSTLNDRDRLLDRLRGDSYVEQLRAVDGPTALIVRSMTAFLGVTLEHVHQWLVTIADELRAKPEIGAVVVVEEAGVCPAYFVEGSLRCLVAPEPQHGIMRTAVLVANPEASTPLTPTEIDALVGPAMLW